MIAAAVALLAVSVVASGTALTMLVALQRQIGASS